MQVFARRYKVIATLRPGLSTTFDSLRKLTSSQEHVAQRVATGPARVVFSPSSADLDHAQLQKCTLTKREFIPAAAAVATAHHPATFNPSPASQMCQTMAFGYSLFFKNKYIRPDLLAKAAASLATELPPLSGRVTPPRRAAGVRSMGEITIDLNNSGLELTLAETKAHCIDDLGPQTWLTGMEAQKLSSFGVPFYAEPFSVEKMYRGEEALFKLKLTRCVDGQILSVTVSHLLADAGRAVRLVERLSQLYRAAATGKDHGHPLHFSPELETPQGLAAAVKNAPSTWAPPSEDHHLTLAQWMATPYRMYRHASKVFDVHMLYLPKAAVTRLKAIAADYGGGQKVSTMDAVQAFIVTLVADLRKRALVPTYPEEMTVNVDLLHRDVPYKDPEALAHHVGNAVHILHVPGVDSGTTVPSPITASDDARAKLATAVGMNARLIRKSVTEFRSDVTNALQALQRQARMTSLPELKVGAAFVVKGADMKVASTTAVTAFSFDQIDFGCGPSVYVQINYQPRFDWWTIIQGAQGYGDGNGVLCTMTLEHGLQDDLLDHPAWRVLLPEAHLFLAGKEAQAKAKKKKEEKINAVPLHTVHPMKAEVAVQPGIWREGVVG